MKLKKLVCLLALMTASMGSCLALESEVSIENCGDFKVLPQEIIQEIIAISPIEIRAVNKTFYFLSSGYKAPGLMGVENPPQEKSDYFAGNPQWSANLMFSIDWVYHAGKFGKEKGKDIPHGKFSGEAKFIDIPSAVWYRLVKEVQYLPLEFVPYLNNTQIHTIHIWDYNGERVKKAIEKLPNTKVRDINTLEPNINSSNCATLEQKVYLGPEYTYDMDMAEAMIKYKEHLRQNSWRYQTASKIKAFFGEIQYTILSCFSKAPNQELFDDEFDDQA